MACYKWCTTRVESLKGLISRDGRIDLFPDDGLSVVDLSVVHGLRVAVAEDHDSVPVVTCNETAVTHLGLTEGVHGPAAGRKGTLIGETGFGKEGGFGGLLNPVHVEDAGRSIRLLKLGIDAVGKIGAIHLGGGILGPTKEK